MTWMNDIEVDEADRFWYARRDEAPNLHEAARRLANLRDWSYRVSDGWFSWPKPGKAAARLQDLLQAKASDYRKDGCEFRNVSTVPGQYLRGDLIKFSDATDEELAAACRPIRSFLTREGHDHSVVFAP